MQPRRAASLTALALLMLFLTGITATGASGVERPRGKKQSRVAIAKRVVVERRTARKLLPLGNDVTSQPLPATGAANGDIIVPSADPEPIGPNPPAPPPRQVPSPKPCTEVVASLTATQAAIREADPGAVVCLADGSYGQLTLAATKSALVTLQAQHPAGAILAGIDISGSELAIERFAINDEVVIEPGSEAISIAHNRISGGYFGIDAGPTSTTTIDDTKIIGNELIGPFGEDAIHLNRYHDGNGEGSAS